MANGNLPGDVWLGQVHTALHALHYTNAAYTEEAVAAMLRGLFLLPSLLTDKQVQSSAGVEGADRCGKTTSTVAAASSALSRLLSHPLPPVTCAAYTALADAARGRGGVECACGAAALLGTEPVIRQLVLQGLADTRAVVRKAAAEAMQCALLAPRAQESGADGSAAHCGSAPMEGLLLPWEPWLACYEHAPDTGAAISAVTAVLRALPAQQTAWAKLSAPLRAIFHRYMLYRR